MRKIDASHARTHFSELLNRVQQGESISITRRGVPIAVLIPVKVHSSDEKNHILKAFYKWRKGIHWGKGMDTKTAISEGRR